MIYRVFQCEAPLQRLTFLYNILCCSINLRGGALASSIYNFVWIITLSVMNRLITGIWTIARYLSPCYPISTNLFWNNRGNGLWMDVFLISMLSSLWKLRFLHHTLIHLFQNKNSINGLIRSVIPWLSSFSYHYRSRMIPSFFPPQLVNAIFNSGKSIHFIRDTLQDTKVICLWPFLIILVVLTKCWYFYSWSMLTW